MSDMQSKRNKLKTTNLIIIVVVVISNGTLVNTHAHALTHFFHFCHTCLPFVFGACAWVPCAHWGWVHMQPIPYTRAANDYYYFGKNWQARRAREQYSGKDARAVCFSKSANVFEREKKRLRLRHVTGRILCVRYINRITNAVRDSVAT